MLILEWVKCVSHLCFFFKLSVYTEPNRRSCRECDRGNCSFCSEFTYLLADCALIFPLLYLSNNIQCVPIILVLSASFPPC